MRNGPCCAGWPASPPDHRDNRAWFKHSTLPTALLKGSVAPLGKNRMRSLGENENFVRLTYLVIAGLLLISAKQLSVVVCGGGARARRSLYAGCIPVASRSRAGADRQVQPTPGRAGAQSRSGQRGRGWGRAVPNREWLGLSLPARGQWLPTNPRFCAARRNRRPAGDIAGRD